MKGSCWHERILVYALHNDGEFNKNSLGAVSEAAQAWPRSCGGEAAAVVVGGDDLTDELCAALGPYGAAKVFRVRAPEGLARPGGGRDGQGHRRHGYSYALFGGGLLGFEIGAGLAARLDAGVTMEVTEVQGRRTAGSWPCARSCRTRPSSTSGYVREPGIIIGRLNAFATAEERRRGRPRWWTSTSSSRSTRPGPRWSSAASSAAPT